jgi:multicomponent Na+:H+ antiporter subunit F
MMTFLLLLIIGCFLCLFRVAMGPTPADRAIAIDTIGIMVVGICGVFGIVTGRDWYLNIAIAWALLSFIGTLALAKYLEGRGFDE